MQDHIAGTKFTVGKLINYLGAFDARLSGEQIKRTVDFGNQVFTTAHVSSTVPLRQYGQGLITDGLSGDSKISDGERALKRRGIYKILDNPQFLLIDDLKGNKIPSYRAPVIYCEKEGSTCYIEFMNVGPLANNYGCGFNFRDLKNPKCYNSKTRGDKESFLCSLKDKTIYISQQTSYKVAEYDNNIKHTIWLMMPTSFFLFQLNLNEEIDGSQHVRFEQRVD